MIQRLGSDDIARLATRVGWFHIDDDEVGEYRKLADAVLSVIETVDPEDGPLVSAALPLVGERVPGRRPTADEDPYGAIVRWCSVRDPAAQGSLGGMRLAIKDSIAIGGIPMTLGSDVVQDFVPAVDSVVVQRLLAAGAEVVATANMDSFAFSGGGDTSAFGYVRNPFDEGRSAGGSSGGSAASLYYPGVVEASIGCDQGGSIRLPAAWCGVLGLKPTHGLVPYTGIVGIDQTFDHVGPIARNAGDLGRLLAVIAGPDPSDPRQAGAPGWDGEGCLEQVDGAPADLDGVRIGLLREGFSDDDDARAITSAAIRDAARRMEAAGAELVEVSVPAHLQAGGIAFAGFIEGMAASLYGGGNGFHWTGSYWPELAGALMQGLARRGDALPPQIKLVALLGAHLQQTYGGAVYARAQNQRPNLVAAIDAGLGGLDCLLLPTVPYVAYELDADLSLSERVLRGWEPLGNCATTDMSGHPALSLPMASANGLPVGGMLIGRRFDDARLVEIARRYERAIGWDPVVTERQRQVSGPAAVPLTA